MREHQKDAVYQGVVDGTDLLAHEVGFGKTAVMVATGMERKRLGLSQRPMYVVPKAIYPQFVKEFREIYPGAVVLAPDETEFKKENRRLS